MNRFERYHANAKPVFLKGWFHTLLVAFFVCGLLITANVYMKSQIQIEAPKVELGQQVIIQLPNGKQIQTYENLIVEKDGKLYYEGEWNTIDITGGTVVYQEWK